MPMPLLLIIVVILFAMAVWLMVRNERKQREWRQKKLQDVARKRKKLNNKTDSDTS